MSKRTVTHLFVGSLIALAGGVVLLLVALWLAWASGGLIMSGSEVVGVRSQPFTWTMVAVAIVAVVVLIGAAITQFVAWIGAVLDTARLPDKTLFIVLLVTGVLSFGLIGMIIYLFAAPDDRARPPLHSADGVAPTTGSTGQRPYDAPTTGAPRS
jgi:preprotein translocase subunit Sss1